MSRENVEQSVTSIISSLAAAVQHNLVLEDKLTREAAEETAQKKLKRLLSIKSAISTTSSFAERQQAAVGSSLPFREIGTGSVGKVFENPDTPWAFKVLLLDGSSKLWNHYIMHHRVQASFDRLGHLSGQVDIPRIAWFASKSSGVWPENIDSSPTNPPSLANLEMSFPIRSSLIEAFCPRRNIEKAKSDPANKDCLVQPLLGRKRYGASRPGGTIFFSLRNYKLHLDQFKELDLDAEGYALDMADALAVLHWHTKIDGMDVEFALGSSPLDRHSIRRAMPLTDIQRLKPGASTYEYLCDKNGSEFQEKSDATGNVYSRGHRKVAASGRGVEFGESGTSYGGQRPIAKRKSERYIEQRLGDPTSPRGRDDDPRHVDPAG
ncbi:hypothetical protein V8E54_009527 [Elaphomyces granulatus]